MLGKQKLKAAVAKYTKDFKLIKIFNANISVFDICMFDENTLILGQSCNRI